MKGEFNRKTISESAGLKPKLYSSNYLGNEEKKQKELTTMLLKT